MKRKLVLLMMILCLLTVIVLPVCASSAYVVDEAGLLDGAQTADIEAELAEISDRHGMDVVIVTVESTDGQSPMDFADDYYDYHGYADDGVLLLVSMEESDLWISTKGYGIQAFTDAGIEYIGDQVANLLSDGDYAAAFETFAGLCDGFITQANSGDPYDTHNLPKAPYRLGRNLVIALVIGLVAALIATGSMKRKLKSVIQKAQADDYVTPGSLQLTRSRDLFLYTHLDRREKPKSSNGSSTHTSSSGATHGGGGRKF